jgi:hypothetical protein
VVELLFEALIGQKQKFGVLIGQKQVKHEREPKEQGIPFLDICMINRWLKHYIKYQLNKRNILS